MLPQMELPFEDRRPPAVTTTRVAINIDVPGGVALSPLLLDCVDELVKASGAIVTGMTSAICGNFTATQRVEPTSKGSPIWINPTIHTVPDNNVVVYSKPVAKSVYKAAFGVLCGKGGNGCGSNVLSVWERPDGLFFFKTIRDEREWKSEMAPAEAPPVVPCTPNPSTLVRDEMIARVRGQYEMGICTEDEMNDKIVDINSHSGVQSV